jgi:hypothetical protein
MAHSNLVHVAAKNGIHPDAGVFAENDIADELRGVVDISCFRDLRSDAFVGANHRE